VTALDAVDLHIPENEFFTLLGPSGCGKTTLLRMIAGFEEPTGGTILLGGADIAGLPPNKRPVNTVFQSYALFPHMTVAQNIGFALRMLGKTKSEIAETVAEMLKLVRMEEPWPAAGRRRFRAASSSASRSPARWPRARACCCSTSRSPRST
jgi:spermidine/putrescine transport system ATP-binding protein